MNVLFVYSLQEGILKNGSLDVQERMQFGISYISSILKKHGHRTELVIISRVLGNKCASILKESIDTFTPKLICFTAVATEYDLMAKMAKQIKRLYPNIYLLIGGVHVTLNPESALRDDFNALCVGEGERPVVELVEQLEKSQTVSGIPNLWIKHGSELERNSPREFFQELDSLPFPDRSMWQKWMSRKAPDRCSVLLSRGCPFGCSYCSNNALRKIASGAYVRHRSPGNIVKEIDEISIMLPSVKVIYLETETISLNIHWCLDLCSALESLVKSLQRPLCFGTNVRIAPNMNMENIFAAFERANFKFVNIGLESGSERVRREILGRDYSNEDIIMAVQSARKHGLRVALYNMLGIPGETLADFKETVRMNQICKPDWNYTSIYYPYPGTDLHLFCKKQGLLPKTMDSRRERKAAVMGLPGFSRKKIQECYLLFDYLVASGADPDNIL